VVMEGTTMAKLTTTFEDSLGNTETIEGDSVAELAAELPEGFEGNLTVHDEQGFVRGWIHSRDDWRAQ
jgi:hypothetical protein